MNFTESVQEKSDAELLKMVYEFDQWSPEMLSAIESELSVRKILPNDINTRKQELIKIESAQLSQGKEASLFGQILGWLTVFGFLGIAIGYNYAFSKIKSKYSDNLFYKYNEDSRKRGKVLFTCSIFLTIAAILYKVISAFEEGN
jgi:hypothetical protein